MVKLTFLGQSGFFIETGSHKIIIDPFITSNPLAQAAGLSAVQFDADAMVLTHGHFDHIEDAPSIAKRTGATVIASFELASYMQSQGAAEAYPMNPGGYADFEFGSVRLTNAVHSSSGPEGQYLGPACGIVLKVEGVTIYHAGDTDLFSDMSLIGKMDQPNVAILPIGSTFTMNAAQALEAVKLIQPDVVIPMHYNTWPPIEADVNAFKQKVEAETSAKVEILDAGQLWESS